MNYFRLLLLLFALGLNACAMVYHPTRSTTTYVQVVDSLAAPDQNFENKIKPYRDKMATQMGQVIGHLAEALTKERPESTMGNWMVDAILDAGINACNCPADLAISNYGGMRVPEIAAGPVTLDKFYEAMPFDNVLVMIELKGSFLREWFKKIAEEGGWPVSKGVRIEIQGGKLQKALVRGEEIDDDKVYKVVTSDYLANGGDRCFFLLSQPRQIYNIFLRDALIQQMQRMEFAGKTVSVRKEGRIVINP